MNSKMPFSLGDPAVASKSITVSAFLKACMLDKRHRLYVFVNTDEVRVLRDTAWLCWTPAALVQMNEVLAPVKSEWNFSFARVDTFLAVGYFAVETKVKHR